MRVLAVCALFPSHPDPLKVVESLNLKGLFLVLFFGVLVGWDLHFDLLTERQRYQTEEDERPLEVEDHD